VTMRLAHVITESGATLAAIDGDEVVLLPDIASTIDDLIAAGSPGLQRLEAAQCESAARMAIVDAQLAAPVLRPSKVMCIGMNYRDHAEEQGIELPRSPVLFAKFPSSLAAPGEEIGWSRALTMQVDWEAELAVIIGKPLRNASREEGLASVFGYTAANDLSARDLQFTDGQWVRAKSLDGFLPIGPAITLAEQFDPSSKIIRSRVNGELMQESNTDQLIFGIGEILEFLSHSFSLLPGDLLLTGTPAGVGAFRDPPRFLADGDVVEIEIEGVGILSNTMRERP
jgi:2-keto-4-pentenoate hydratase/2-oxohepta-3-ene-1,7-dioic acid hydratase in catechol pathway